MGGNIVTKYLGEKKSIPQIIAGISACQVVINKCYKLVHSKPKSPIIQRQIPNYPA
jgi:predicted alpha/beta-fold hydrolase